MTALALFAAALACASSVVALPQSSFSLSNGSSGGTLPVLSFAPAGFSSELASSTADHESPSQKGPCSNLNCPNPFPSISGPSNIGQSPLVYTAAGSPSIFGTDNGCGACGQCYEVVNSGKPHCPDCGGKTQSGPASILVMITNACMDCVPSGTKANTHFDILNPPSGWDNPDVYFRRLPAASCLSNVETS